MWWRGIGEEKMGMVRNKYMSDQGAEDEGLHIRLLCWCSVADGRSSIKVCTFSLSDGATC